MTLSRNTPLRRGPPPRRSSRKSPRRWQCRFCAQVNEPGAKRCSSCTIGKRTERTSIRKDCDKLASLLCKIRAGFRCERCGRPGEPNAKGQRILGLEWSHRPSCKRSSSMATRWDDDAADCLCHECHRDFEKRPVAYNTWLVERGVDVEDLERRAGLLWDKSYPIARLRAALVERQKEAA